MCVCVCVCVCMYMYICRIFLICVKNLLFNKLNSLAKFLDCDKLN